MPQYHETPHWVGQDFQPYDNEHEQEDSRPCQNRQKTEEIRLDRTKFVKLLYGFEILSDFEQLNEDEVNDSILTDLDAF